MTMASRRRLGPFAAIAAIVLMGGALLVTVGTTFTSANDASASVLRGQTDVLLRALAAELGPRSDGEAPDAAVLEEALEALRGDGLRYVAVVAPGGQILAAAGTPAGGAAGAAGDTITAPPRSAEAFMDRLVRVDGRVRVVFRAPPARHFRGRAGLRADSHHGGGGARAWFMVVELEAQKADALRAAATRTLGIGAVAAAVLLVLAGVLVRALGRENARALELEQKRRLASLGELSAVLAHEIRNPLASLKGNAQLLAGSLPEGEKARRKADLVVSEAVRLEHLTNDLLEFVRTGAIRREAVDPRALLGECAAAADPSGGIAVDAAGAPATWSLDPARLRQVLMNLLGNAVQAGAPVSARVTTRGGALVFEICDRGPGVPEAERARVFEPFFTRRAGGTGLGLAVAHRVAELHGGGISVDDAPGGGARFTVSLPAA